MLARGSAGTLGDRRRQLLALLLMIAVALIVAGIAIQSLYRTALKQALARRVEVAKSQASIIEAMARFSADRGREEAEAAILSQLLDAQGGYVGASETSEITIAKRDGEDILLLVRHRHGHADLPDKIRIKPAGNIAEPMRRALSGLSGTMIGRDYQGAEVLAAYRPVAGLGWGIVSKIDLEEVRAPFVTAALLGGGGALVVITLGALLFLRVSNPLLEHLEESEEKHRLIVASALDAIITSDADMVITGWNPQAELLFGRTDEEAIGRRLTDIVIPRQPLGAEANELWHSFTNGKGPTTDKRIELTVAGRDGREVPVEMKISPVRRRGTTFLNIFVSDRTECKRAEEEASHHRAELAHVLRVTTLGELVGGLAHELNQPLTAIANDVTACAMYLQSGRGGMARLQDLLEHASVEAQRAGQIVHHLREFLQKRPQKMETIDLRDLIRNVSQLMTTQIEQESIALKLHLSTQALPVRADPIQIEQVLVNLIQNAVEAIKEAGNGQAQLDIQTSRCADGTVQVAVTDTGVGLADATQERLLEPFFTTKQHGLGMGLPICRSIIEAHGGDFSIGARTDGSTGTMARFTLALEAGRIAAEQS